MSLLSFFELYKPVVLRIVGTDLFSPRCLQNAMEQIGAGKKKIVTKRPAAKKPAAKKKSAAKKKTTGKKK